MAQFMNEEVEYDEAARMLVESIEPNETDAQKANLIGVAQVFATLHLAETIKEVFSGVGDSGLSQILHNIGQRINY